MNQNEDEVIHLKWDHYSSLHRFNLRRSEWQFSKLLEKIRNIHSLFNDTLGYIDEDGDCVIFTSSLEMDEMLELSKTRNEKVIRIKSTESKKEEEQTPKDLPKHEKEVHPNIMCDLCDKFIAGIRYKCTICDDYDLCEDCEKTGIHPEHPMLRLANPRTPKVPFELKRRWMRGNRCGRHMGQPPRGPFTPFVINEAIQNAMRRSATFPQQNAEAPPKPSGEANKPTEQQEPKGAEFLKDVGTMLQQVLSNFGIDVDMSIEHNNKREKIPTEAATPLVKTPEMPPSSFVSTQVPSEPAPAVPVELKKSEELQTSPPKGEDPTQKAAQEIADKTAKEVIEAVTNDVLKKTEEVVDFAVNTVNNIAENPQTKEEMEKIMQNAAQATQFAINQAAELVKRNSSYMAANAENPQFRSIMASVSLWADQLAQYYPGINPQEPPVVAKNDSPHQQMYVDKPEPKVEIKREPTAPEPEPKVETIVDLMSLSNISMATAQEQQKDDDFIPTINKEMFYKDVKEKDISSVGTNTEFAKKSAETQYYSDDSDVEIISSSSRETPPPSNVASAPPTSNVSPFPPEPVFPEDDEGWTLMNNANYEAMCKFYEAKRKAEDARREELEEQIEKQRLIMAKAAKQIEEEAKKSAQPANGNLYPTLQNEDNCSAGIPYPTMPSTVRPHTKICFFKHPDALVQSAVDQLEAMGYDNCNGWLTRLSEKCQGDISMVLDEAAKDPLHLARLD